MDMYVYVCVVMFLHIDVILLSVSHSLEISCSLLFFFCLFVCLFFHIEQID